MVEQVEEFSPELQVHTFAEGQREVLDQREISVHKARAVYRGACSRTKFSRWSWCESARIKPALNRVDLRGGVATGIPGHGTRLIWVADLIRTLERISVIGEEHTGFIGAIHDKQWESGRCPFDEIYLPVPQYSIGGATPIAAELPAFAEWQVIQDAGRKGVIQIQLRQSPIEFRTPGQRVVQGAGIRAQAVGHAGVECSRPGVAQ